MINRFDWSGMRDGHTGWAEAIRAECERQGVKPLGLYGPSQVEAADILRASHLS